MSSPPSGGDGGAAARALTEPAVTAAPGQAAALEVALRGTLDDVALFDVLRLLAATPRTGVLWVHHPFPAAIHLVGGRIGCVRAEATVSLGDALRRGGVEERAAPGRDPAVGRVLAVTSDPGRAERIVREHVGDLLFELAILGEGPFEFVPGVPDPWSSALTADVAEVAEEHDRQVARWKEIAASLPPAGTRLVPVPRLADGVDEVAVAWDEWRVLVLLDGRRGVPELVADCDLPALETSKAVAGLLRKGLVAPAP